MLLRVILGIIIIISAWWLILWATGTELWSGVFWLVVLGTFILGIGTGILAGDDD